MGRKIPGERVESHDSEELDIGPGILMHNKKSIISLMLALICTFSVPVFAGFDEGAAEFKRGNYAAAMKEWQPLAEVGDGQAANAIGALYDRGLGVNEDDKEAAKWYQIGAEAGLPLAMRNLANLYSIGQGVPYDMAQARYWYEKAAELGDEPAIRRLAKINNRPVPPSEANTANAQVSGTAASNLASPPPSLATTSLDTGSNAPITPASASAASPATTPPSRPVQVSSNSTVQDLRTKPVLPAPPKNGPTGPSVKAAPVPRVQETALAEPTPSPTLNESDAGAGAATGTPADATATNGGTSPLLTGQSSQNPASSANEPSPTPAPEQIASRSPEPEPQPADPTGNWLIGQWQGPSLGCPPYGGLAFTPSSVDTYYNGKVIVSLKATYNITADVITVTTHGLDGNNQDYVYRRLDADRFIIEKVPAAMPASLVGAEHKKCSA